jgi:hypothetical protein
MSFDYNVHKTNKHTGETIANHYMQLSSQEGSILLRGGMFWGADGSNIEVAKVPDWVIDAMETLTEEALNSVGFSGGVKTASRAPDPKPVSALPKRSKQSGS